MEATAVAQVPGRDQGPRHRLEHEPGAPPPGAVTLPGPVPVGDRPARVRAPREGWVDPRDEFIALVNLRRKRLGVTWSALAEQLGVSKQTMSRFKAKTTRGPSKDLVERLLGRWPDLGRPYARAYGKPARVVSTPPGPEGR